MGHWRNSVVGYLDVATTGSGGIAVVAPPVFLSSIAHCHCAINEIRQVRNVVGSENNRNATFGNRAKETSNDRRGLRI